MIKLSMFSADVTPPMGSPLCGGVIKPAEGVAEPLSARGIILQDGGLPVVLCAVDWCEIHNADSDFWRSKIAAEIGTTPDRVAVQCVHQHNAPLADTAAHDMLITSEGALAVMDVTWCREAAERTAQAAGSALLSAVTVTHIGTGQAEVREIASNRRVMNAQGKVERPRWSKCTEPDLRAAPVGKIDPAVRTVSFWDGGQRLASLHYYASHPTSYFGDGMVTSEFVGMARNRCEREGGAAHIYFTGCAGDITAGKYNTGSPEDRVLLTDRLFSALQESERDTTLTPANRLEWRTNEIRLPENGVRSLDSLRALAADSSQSASVRVIAAFEAVFKERLRTKPEIVLSCLALGDSVRILHLPGEPFVDYQLTAQREAPDNFVAVAGYGDGGPGYILLAQSYDEGGYEPTGAFVGPESEAILKGAIRDLLTT